jgi:hypothetical protein
VVSQVKAIIYNAFDDQVEIHLLVNVVENGNAIRIGAPLRGCAR